MSKRHHASTNKTVSVTQFSIEIGCVLQFFYRGIFRT